MAKHKSATEVTLQTEEKSSLELWVHRNWPKAAVVGVIIAGGILFMQSRTSAAEAALGEEWNELADPTDDLAAFQSASQKVAGTPLEGWARFQEMQKALSEDDLQAASAAAAALKGLDSHLLNRLEFPAGPDGGTTTLGKQLSERLAAQAAWEAENAGVLSNPDLPADAPKLTIKTSLGDIEVGLYSDLAPEHSANFVKVAKADQYDGTKFHRTVNSPGLRLIEGGDPNTLTEDATTWGSGGPGYTLEQEKNGLIHDSGYLSMTKPPGELKSSGSQFFITLSRAHHMDGQNTVFGKVLSGMDVVRQIAEAPQQAPDPTSPVRDRPEDPVTITDVVVNE